MIEENPAPQWLTRVQQEGYRLTATRCIIVEIMANTDVALDASTIHKIANKKYTSIGLVSVYRTLSILERLGLIQRIHMPEKCQAYISAFASHQHLIICNNCGRVDFFSGDGIGKLVKKVEMECNYQVQGHWLQLFGMCKQCLESGQQEDY